MPPSTRKSPRLKSPARSKSPPRASSPAKSPARAKSPAAKGSAKAAAGGGALFSKEDVIVVLLAVAAWDHTLRKAGVLGGPLSLDCLGSPAWLGLAAAAAATHTLYAFIWYKPAAFKALARKLKPLGSNAVEVFHALVMFGKCAQQVAVVLWAADAASTTVGGLLGQASNEQWALFVLFAGAGQYLNAGIYRAIGKDGVYYGFKLGRPVPWSNAGVFKLGFRHPQYVGSILTQLGVIAPLATKATVGAGLVELTAAWLLFYALTSVQEASGDNDKKKK